MLSSSSTYLKLYHRAFLTLFGGCTDSYAPILLPKRKVYSTIVDIKWRHEQGATILEFGNPFSSDLSGISEANPENYINDKTPLVVMIENLLTAYDYIFLVENGNKHWKSHGFEYFRKHSHKKIILCHGEREFLTKYQNNPYYNSIVVAVDSDLTMTLERWVAANKISIPIASANDIWDAMLKYKGFLYQFCSSLGKESLLPQTRLADAKTYHPSMIDEIKSDNVILKLPSNTKGTGACVLSKQEAKEMLNIVLKTDVTEYKTTDRMLETKAKEFIQGMGKEKENCFVIQELIQSNSEDLIEGYDPTYRALVNFYVSEHDEGTRFKLSLIGISADFPDEKIDLQKPRSCKNMLVSASTSIQRSRPFPKSEESRLIAQLSGFFKHLFVKMQQHSLLSYFDSLSVDDAGKFYIKRMIDLGCLVMNLNDIVAIPPTSLNEFQIRSLIVEIKHSLRCLGNILTSSKFDTNFPQVIQLFFALKINSASNSHIEMLKDWFKKHTACETSLIKSFFNALEICSHLEKNNFALTIALLELYDELPKVDRRISRRNYTTEIHSILIEGFKERIFHEKKLSLSSCPLHFELINKIDKHLNDNNIKSTNRFSRIFSDVYQYASGQFGTPSLKTQHLYNDIQTLLAQRFCKDSMPNMPLIAEAKVEMELCSEKTFYPKRLS